MRSAVYFYRHARLTALPHPFLALTSTRFFPLGARARDRFTDRNREQGKHQLMMTSKHNAATATHGGALDHVHPRTILAHEIHVGRREAFDLIAQIAREVECLQEYLRHHDRRSEIE